MAVEGLGQGVGPRAEDVCKGEHAILRQRKVWIARKMHKVAAVHDLEPCIGRLGDDAPL